MKEHEIHASVTTDSRLQTCVKKVQDPLRHTIEWPGGGNVTTVFQTGLNNILNTGQTSRNINLPI